MQTSYVIKKLEVEESEVIIDMVFRVMNDANQLPNTDVLAPEDVKKILHKLIRKDMSCNHLLCYGIYEQEKLIAMIGYEQFSKKITYLYVLREYQGQGLGTSLLDFVIKNETEASIILLRAHESAVIMYEKYGFQRNGDDSLYAIGMEYVLRRN